MPNLSAGLRRGAAVALAAAALPAAAQAATPAQVDGAVSAGATWIRSQQVPATGEIAGFGGDAALSALAAAGVHPADVRAGGPSAQDFYAGLWASSQWATPPDPATGSNPGGIGTSNFEQAILQARPTGLDLARLSASSNLVAQLASLHHAGGAYGPPSQFSLTVFGLLAMARTPASPAVLAESAKTIRANRHDDGGWNFGLVTSDADRTAVSDIDVTGATLAALCESGATSRDPVVAGGLAFLRGKLDSATGGFNAQFGQNTDSNAWAVSGLNACRVDPQSPAWTTTAGKTPVDFLVSQQRTSGPFAGSFRYAPGEDDSFISLFSTQDAVRALAGQAFSARTPARANQADPSSRPRPKVAKGTLVPVTLAVDDGRGDIRLCRVLNPSGAGLASVLLRAYAPSKPGACVNSLDYSSDGQLYSVNGKQGSWQLRLDRAAEVPAANQPVSFGQFVSLRRQAPGTVTASRASIDLGTVRVGRSSAVQEMWIRMENASERLTVALTGANKAQFAIAADGCTGKTVQPGAGCPVRVRFNPTGTGARSATLTVSGASGSTPASVALTGRGS